MPLIVCRWCGGDRGDLVLDLGAQPASEYFPPVDEPGPDPLFPLRLWLCAGCGLAQLPDDDEVPEQPEGIEPRALTDQRRDAVAAAAAVGLLPAGGTVVEGPTPHGGSWLPGLAGLGIHPAAAGERADVVVDGSFGLMHARDQAAALDGLLARLADDGVFLFQFHSLAAILRHGQWNAVRHGHFAYYSTPTAVAMLAERGLTVTDAWTFPLYGGTVLLAARRGGSAGPSVSRVVDAELAAGVHDPVRSAALQDAVGTSATALRAAVDRAVADGGRVMGYSAASRAVALLRIAGIGPDTLTAVADASPAKHGCRMPGSAIPVVPPDELVAATPGVVVLFVPDLMDEVRAALPEVEAAGGRWVPADATL
ncbi:class I SAM-dependent methyltransferase [Pseudonocardia sp. N23]|uniref:class I SAM-dependent methyltransferase n=1 Tax=Pseudonocardia sp. N23 TaxID=1987376 RepID=UPI000C02D3DC|nr:class I SAM-dependent methyltransferase [Pseudonocardia sp. N23]GAY12203.1 methyltransferase, putative [Pseudonocardia sp. N23]